MPADTDALCYASKAENLCACLSHAETSTFKGFITGLLNVLVVRLV